MTEYDFSPEAYDKYIQTQQRIACWVDNTNRIPQKGPETPPTPAGHNTDLPTYTNEGADARNRRSSKHSSKHHRRQHTDSRVYEHYRPPSPVSTQRPPSSRHRTLSYSQSPHRPSPVRSQTSPQQQKAYYSQPIPMAREHSGQSSRTSGSTQVFSSNAYMPHSSSSRLDSASTVQSFSYPFPQQHYPDYSSVRTRQEPSRSNTAPAHIPAFPTSKQPPYPSSPAYPYQPEKNYYVYQPNSGPVVVNLPNGGQYIVPPQSQNIDVSKLPLQPQLPFSAYETEKPKKQLPLLKRLFTGFGSNKNSNSARSTGVRTPEPKPTNPKLRKRRSSFNL